MSTFELGPFEALAAMSDAMMFITDLEANSLWVNDALVETTGYTLEDYQFQRFENPFIPEEDVARVTAFLGELLASEEPVSDGFVRNRFVDRWGGTLHVRTRVAKITWEGAPALLYITELEGRDDSALEVEHRYRSLVEAATDSIVRLRPDLTVHYSNATFQRMVERTPVELRTTALHELVSPNTREAVRQRLLNVRDRSALSLELANPDGSVTYLDGTFVRVRAGEHAGMLQAFLRDTTEKRLLAERVQRAQQRESLAQLAGGVAHDLNNILGGILGSANLASRDLPTDHPLAVPLGRIALGAERAGQLASSMLAYAGEGNAARQTVDLAEIVAETEPLMSAALPKGVDLHIDTPAGEPVLVSADQLQLRQLVMNLVLNAADASAVGGRITARAAVVAAADALAGRPATSFFGSMPSTPQVAIVQVTDDGCGMPAQVLRRIFDPFFSTKGKGRGLGLAAALGILERHGGGASVVSEAGAGTDILVVLPWADVELPAPREQPEASPAHVGGRVLIIDDEEAIRIVTRRALEPLGYTVLEAASGEEGLNFFAGASPAIDVVILDQTMPGMGGDRTLRELRARGSSVPVIRTSGYQADPSLTPPEEGVWFLGKPFGIRQLTSLVASALQPSPTDGPAP